mgnify:CR=1 FL=1|tara:strand:- start:17 stop:421 length:405 start_codon:yes stop_codon:yes gene_type:complete
MTKIKSKRELQIDTFIDNIETQTDYEKNNELIITKYYKKFNKELEDYKYIKNIDDFILLKEGGYIRYINLNDDLKWGGILLKKYKFNDMNMMVLSNSYCKNFTISFNKNVVFYKKHITQSDKTKKLFLSYLDKY